MSKEIELTVYGIDRDAIVRRLEHLNAVFKGSYKFKTINFQLEKKGKIESIDPNKGDEKFYSSWLRIRTDGRKTTLTLKEQSGTTISKRNEYEVDVDDFLKITKIMTKLLPKATYMYSESEREEYKLGEAIVDINKRPYLPYSIEIEASSEVLVNRAYQQLEIKKMPMKSIAVSDDEFYGLFGVDYTKVRDEYERKLKEMISESDKI